MTTKVVPFAERRGRCRLACGCEYKTKGGCVVGWCGTGSHAHWHAAHEANAPVTLLDEAPRALAVGDVVKAKDVPVGATFYHVGDRYQIWRATGSGKCSGVTGLLQQSGVKIDIYVGCTILSLPESKDAPVPVVTPPQYRPLFGGVALNRGFPTLPDDEVATGIEHVAPGYAVGDGCTTGHQSLDDRIAEIT